VRHLVKHLQISVSNDGGTEVVVFVFEQVDMVKQFGLPMQEVLYFEELRCRDLQEQPAGQIKGALMLEHLRQANPVHKPHE